MEKKMEKETKKKEIKKPKVVNETKKAKEIKAPKKDNNVVITKDIRRIVKFTTMMATFFASLFVIIVFVFSVMTTLSVMNNTRDELLDNNFAMTFISKLSNNTIYDTKLNVQTTESNFIFATVNIILPSIVLIGALILIIYFAHLIDKFLEDTETEKELFTTQKTKELENIINIVSLIIFIFSILFNRPAMIFVLLIFFLLYAIYFLFKKCAKYNEK